MPIIFAACFFIGKNVAQAVEPPAHLWHFDECAGQVLSDSVGVEDLTQKAIWTPGKWQCGINQPYQSPYFLDKFFSQAMPPGELTISYYWRNSSYPYEGRNHLYLKNYYDQVLAGIRLSPNSRCLYLQGDDIVSQSGAPHDDAWHLVTVTYSAEQMVFYLIN